MALPTRKIAVLDGDGAVIMNVNGLITVGRVRPKNLIHIVFDNKIYESSWLCADGECLQSQSSGFRTSCRHPECL